MISSIKLLKSVRVTLVEGRIKLHGGAALCEYTRSTNYLKVQVLVLSSNKFSTGRTGTGTKFSFEGLVV